MLMSGYGRAMRNTMRAPNRCTPTANSHPSAATTERAGPRVQRRFGDAKEVVEGDHERRGISLVGKVDTTSKPLAREARAVRFKPSGSKTSRSKQTAGHPDRPHQALPTAERVRFSVRACRETPCRARANIVWRCSPRLVGIVGDVLAHRVGELLRLRVGGQAEVLADSRTGGAADRVDRVEDAVRRAFDIGRARAARRHVGLGAQLVEVVPVNAAAESGAASDAGDNKDRSMMFLSRVVYQRSCAASRRRTCARRVVILHCFERRGAVRRRSSPPGDWRYLCTVCAGLPAALAAHLCCI